MFKFLKNRLSKIQQALSKTKSALSDRIIALFKEPLDEETFEKLEQILYEADLGGAIAADLVEQTRQFLKKNRDAKLEEILSFYQQKSLEILESPPQVIEKKPSKGIPTIFLIVGVNGTGKTTSIAKLANQFKADGKKILLAAGDTFRAAAIEQLASWAERLDVPIIKSSSGGDPAAVAYDAVEAAISRKVDVVLIDTAGRLQNKMDLMRELEKIQRVIQKIVPEAPHETLLILDATTGQNALDQARVFHSSTPLTGIFLAKLDGSAKGGIVLSIYKELKIPIKWIGLGETLDDLMPFDKVAYTRALFNL